VIRIHGGGLTSGSKADISMTFVSQLLAKGFSVASINYRLSPEVIVPDHYLDCARAIQYFRLHAKELNIDPDKIGATGSSAGALASFWIAFHDDLADPSNPDSVLRMSTRLKGVANWSGQTTVDKRVALEWIGPIVLEFSSYFKGTIFGLPADSMDTPAAYALQEMASPVTHLTQGDPPVWMYYSYVNPPANSSEAIHHVNFGIHLKQMMDSLDIASTLLTPSFSGSINESAVNFFADIFADSISTGVKKDPAVGSHFRLEQNFPNPFNPATTIDFTIPNSGFVSVKVFDLLGKEVAVLVNDVLTAGTHSRIWNAAKVSSGMYYYRLQSGNYVETKRMLLLK
ncbi:MAG: alpha/beta hydrolase fold domain-containing protein, partial [Bacteroidota bacterium]